MSRHTRLAQVACVAAAGYAVTGAVELAHDQAPVFADTLDWIIEGAFAIGMAASFVVLVAIARATLPRPEPATGWALAAIGTAALGAAALASTIAGRHTFDPFFIDLGFLAIMIGYSLLAFAHLRQGLPFSPSGGMFLFAGFIPIMTISGSATAGNLLTGYGTLMVAWSWAVLAGRISSLQDAPRSPR